MIIRLFCPRCAQEAKENIKNNIAFEVPVPVSTLSDDGKYEVHCKRGHRSKVILDNIKFELLFEMGLNAIIDGYYRESISAFSSALEKYYEFYWHVVMNHNKISKDKINDTWKPLSKYSERQIGAYSTAVILLKKSTPRLLNPNKEIKFRNRVIHDGYVPTEDESVSFGDRVMSIINEDLSDLRLITPDALKITYDEFSPYTSKENDNEVEGRVNILTAIDVRFPPKKNDLRIGGVKIQLDRIRRERSYGNMKFLSFSEFDKKYPDVDLPDFE